LGKLLPGLPSWATVAARIRPQRHRTKVRRRRGLWVVSCACAWSEETVSKFSALLALQRHLEPQGRPEAIRQAQV